MILSSFSVKNLFDLYSYEFSLGEKQNLFMITGPNGYGKTTILSIINSLSIENIYFFYLLTFDEIQIGLRNNTTIKIISNLIEEDNDSDRDERVVSEKQIDFLWIQEGKLVNKFTLNKRNIKKSVRSIGFYKGTQPNVNNIRSESFIDFIKSNPQVFEYIAKEQGQEQFLLLLNSLSSTFITAQRIHPIIKNINGNIANKTTIGEVVRKLQEKMQLDYIQYLRKSQSIDTKFIDVLLSTSLIYEEAEYNEKAILLEKQIENLSEFGLVSNIKIKAYDKNDAKILTAYLNDFSEKIEVYAKTAEKLRLFSSLLRKKSFSHKQVSFSPEYGLRIITEREEFLDVNRLSSGEQNEIIMLYNFIFEVSDKTVLLIDEPENSLHVAWQKEFIEDIEEITALKNIQTIIATHSPQIIGERWKDCFDLYEQCK